MPLKHLPPQPTSRASQPWHMQPCLRKFVLWNNKLYLNHKFAQPWLQWVFAAQPVLCTQPRQPCQQKAGTALVRHTHCKPKHKRSVLQIPNASPAARCMRWDAALRETPHDRATLTASTCKWSPALDILSSIQPRRLADRFHTPQVVASPRHLVQQTTKKVR